MRRGRSSCRRRLTAKIKTKKAKARMPSQVFASTCEKGKSPSLSMRGDVLEMEGERRERAQKMQMKKSK